MTILVDTPAVLDRSRQVGLKQAVIALMLVAPVAACTKWVPNTKPLPTEQGKGISKARLYLADGQVMTMTGVLLRGDSVVGWSGGRGVTLSAADITKVERQVMDGVKTGLALGGVALLVGGLAAAQQFDPWAGCCSRVGRMVVPNLSPP